jgi:uncharacterized protein (UPF0332 family)
LLEKASGAIDAATTLLDAGHLESAASRCYYAMFYVAEALLAEQDLRFRKHGGVHAAFGEHLVKSGQLDAKFHRWLLDAFDRRIQADYGVEAEPTRSEVEEMIEQARAFLTEARRRS